MVQRSMPSDTGSHRPRTLLDALVLTVMVLVLHLPFLDQALVIDDGSYVNQALQILENPAGPYSFKIQIEEVRDFFRYFANPPGHAYYLAGMIRCFGDSEMALHTFCMVFSFLAVFAVYALARELTGRGLFAALLFLATPAFFVSSHTIMADVPAAGFAILAVCLFLRGVDRERLPLLVLSGFFAGAASLFKYSGLTVLPLMLLYLLLRRRVRWTTLAPLGIAAGLFGAWCIASQCIYGQAHVVAAFALETESTKAFARILQGVAVLTGLGGAAVFPPMLLLWSIRSSLRMSRIGGLCAVGLSAGAFLAWLPDLGVEALAYDFPNRLLGGLFFAAGVSTLTFIVLCGIAALRRLPVRPDSGGEDDRILPARTLLLVLWILGFLILDGGLIFATPKYLISAMAPLILLLLGTGGGTAEPPWIQRPWLKGAAWAATLAVALSLAVVNAAHGDSHRRMVNETIPELAGRHTVWFNGHWTIRYYSERAGFRYLPGEETPEATLESGDLLFLVLDAVFHAIDASMVKKIKMIDEYRSPSPLPLLLMNRIERAGYWSHTVGMLPYLISTRPVSVVRIFRVR